MKLIKGSSISGKDKVFTMWCFCVVDLFIRLFDEKGITPYIDFDK